jgi:hypothetical protein
VYPKSCHVIESIRLDDHISGPIRYFLSQHGGKFEPEITRECGYLISYVRQEGVGLASQTGRLTMLVILACVVK